jgi:NAD(P)-dependent dehydrogenase (short-subunit alcohol dehydrogenase family)
MKLKHDNPISATLAGLLDRRSMGRSVPPLGRDERLEGRTALVTGANRGLGKSIAVQLAQRGAKVIMACRSGIPEAGREVRMAAGVHEDAVEMRQVDLGDLDSVARFCDGLCSDNVHVDLLILNAGVVPVGARPTSQGFEIQFGVNYLANMALTQRVLEDGVLPNAAFAGNALAMEGLRPRIVMVSSETHRDAGEVDFGKLGVYADYGAMEGVKVYGYSKLLLNTYAAELDRRLNADAPGGCDVAVHSLCPGAVNTDIAREAPEFAKPLLKAVMGAFFRSPAQAAEPVLYLSLAHALEGKSGKYFHLMNEKPAADEALRPNVGAKLWEASEQMLKDGHPPRA